MIFYKISGVIRLISLMMFFFNYKQMMQEYLLLQLEYLDMQSLWFQQDGATPHTAMETMAILRAAFPGRLILRFGDVSWPPLSPDLTLQIYSYGRYLKGKFYLDMPNTLHKLKNNILEQINRITPDILKKSV